MRSNRIGPIVLFPIGDSGNVRCGLSTTRNMVKKKDKKDKKLHNSLHNSTEPDLSWQESIDLLPEDEVEGGSEIYYFTDEDGNVHSREFFAEELVPSDDDDLKDLRERKLSYEKVERLKPETLDIVGLSRSPQQPKQQEVVLPVPKSGARPLDIRISSEVTPDLLTDKESRQQSIEGKQVIIHLQDSSAAEEAINSGQNRKADDLKHSFTQTDLDAYVAYRSEGLAKKSKDWIARSSEALWESTGGEISHQTMTSFRTFILEKYKSADSHSKVLGFAIGFLNFLAQRNIDPSYLSFRLFLERPKTVKVKKALTERIVTREDITHLFNRIDAYAENGKISAQKTRNYRAFALLASYTGLRPSTIQRLTVGQFRNALSEERPVLHVLAEQEKNRVEHYVPLHPVVVDSIRGVLKHDFGENDDAKPLFLFNSFEKWLERQRIPLPRVRDPTKAHMWLSDFRKFAEQFGDIGWDATNRKYILAHGMTGVDWEHYKHPLPEDVYDSYMRCWRDVELTK
jgi:integrase